ncbi:MAG: hypothetical protein ACOC0C_02785 [Bacteroidota bacterium]
MNLYNRKLYNLDKKVTQWMAKNGLKLLRISLGIIFTWYGALKFFEGLSPAESFAIETIDTMFFGIIPEDVIIYGLATWETLIGLGLLFKIFMRGTLLLLFAQMLGTFTPIFLLPEKVFVSIPFVLTIEGQYIFKNLVVISAAIVLGATVRGARIDIEDEEPKE